MGWCRKQWCASACEGVASGGSSPAPESKARERGGEVCGGGAKGTAVALLQRARRILPTQVPRSLTRTVSKYQIGNRAADLFHCYYVVLHTDTIPSTTWHAPTYGVEHAAGSYSIAGRQRPGTGDRTRVRLDSRWCTRVSRATAHHVKSHESSHMHPCSNLQTSTRELDQLISAGGGGASSPS